MAIWGSTFAVVRALVGGSQAPVSPMLLVAVRMALASALLAAWLAVRGGLRFCAAVFAVHIIALGRVAGRHPILPLLLVQLVGTGAMAAVAGPFVERQHFSPDPRALAAVAYLAVFATLLTFGVQTWAQRRLPPVRMALLSALEPAFAALWAAGLIGGRLHRLGPWGGAALVLGGAAGEARAGRKAAPLPAGWRKPFALGSLTLTLYPAGHVLGSAQLCCEVSGRSILYAGDLGGSDARAPATAEAQERVPCDALLLRATYGHPRYSFPPRAEVLEELSRFVAGTLAERRTPVVLAAAIGGAQEAIRNLAGHELRLHPAPLRLSELSRSH